jgi:TolB-like protein/Tfp pilus assembly protein PilF
LGENNKGMQDDAPPDHEAKLEIAHVLSMDVVGYSKLLIDQQTRILADLNRVVRATTRFRVALTARKMLSLPTGDGMILVFFGEPEAALECAMEINSALKEHPEIGLRMGIHSGPVDRITDVNEAPNLAGAGIDIAQRVMDCGDAGHILLSRRVAYDLAPLPRWNRHLFELGDCEVKHGQKVSLVNFHREEIGNPVVPAKVQRAQEVALAQQRKAARSRRSLIMAVLAVLIVIGSTTVLLVHRRFSSIGPPPPAVAAPDKSIAVLPFVDMSQTKDQEYFCDGISEELLDTLAKTDGLRVVARTSSFSFKGQSVDAGEIGRKLNVSTVLEGSLRREGNRVRITAQLVNTRDGFHLWSETYERELQGVFALQDEITQAIVAALKVKLAVAPIAREPHDTEAYDLYLQGLFFSNKSGEADLRKSLDLFRQALAKDPKLSRAWTGVAKDWIWLADAYVKPREAYPQVEVAARKALALSERDAEAHAYLGEVKRVLMWDVKGEEAELSRALQIDPNSAVAHLFMALLQGGIGDRVRGLVEMQMAVKLDPLSPIIGNFQVDSYVSYGRLDDAFAAAQRTMEIDPNYVYFEPDLALVYRAQGKLNEALDIYLRVAQVSKQPSAGLAITYARLGRTAEAKKVLDELINVANTHYFPGEQIASVYVALGDKDEAFRWLDRAMDERSGPIHSIAVRPEFRPLYSDPRFARALERIGIDPARILSEKK